MLSRSPPLALAAHSRVASFWTFAWHVVGCDPRRGLSAIAKLRLAERISALVPRIRRGQVSELILGSGRELEVSPPKVPICGGHFGGRAALEAFCCIFFHQFFEATLHPVFGCISRISG